MSMKGFRILLWVFLLILMTCLAFPLSILASETMAVPQSFYGNLLLTGGGKAPAGVALTALVNGVEFGRIVTTEPGKYGSDISQDKKLIVQGRTLPDKSVVDIPPNALIEFYADGQKCNPDDPNKARFHSGESTYLTLTYTPAPSPTPPTPTTTTPITTTTPTTPPITTTSSGGGGGGGGSGGGFVSPSPTPTPTSTTPTSAPSTSPAEQPTGTTAMPVVTPLITTTLPVAASIPSPTAATSPSSLSPTTVASVAPSTFSQSSSPAISTSLATPIDEGSSFKWGMTAGIIVGVLLVVIAVLILFRKKTS
jgi:hypothetical protein